MIDARAVLSEDKNPNPISGISGDQAGKNANELAVGMEEAASRRVIAQVIERVKLGGEKELRFWREKCAQLEATLACEREAREREREDHDAEIALQKKLHEEELRLAREEQTKETEYALYVQRRDLSDESRTLRREVDDLKELVVEQEERLTRASEMVETLTRDHLARLAALESSHEEELRKAKEDVRTAIKMVQSHSSSSTPRARTTIPTPITLAARTEREKVQEQDEREQHDDDIARDGNAEEEHDEMVPIITPKGTLYTRLLDEYIQKAKMQAKKK